LPDINHANPTVRGFAERTAINTPIQGTAADLIKLAMIQVDAALTEQNLKAAMLLSVHDELVFEVPPEEVETLKQIVKEEMESALPLDIPIRVDIGVGKNWAEAK
ncbi:MAG: DNA polymerase I, partial [Candidatus Margulisbacteria bacterium]|nr:DNA polymerase I [Candidatus Margulisiibacteriota bacterium]